MQTYVCALALAYQNLVEINCVGGKLHIREADGSLHIDI